MTISVGQILSALALRGLTIMRSPSDDGVLPDDLSTLPSNNMLVMDCGPSAGTYPGITIFSRNTSCGHIHFGSPDEPWGGELDFNWPTREFKIRIGDTPVGERKEVGIAINNLKRSRFGLGIPDSDGTAFRDDAMLTTQGPNSGGLASFRATSPYASGNSRAGGMISFGVEGAFNLNGGYIKSSYNGNWSSDLEFGVRDTTGSSDGSNNMDKSPVLMALRGTRQCASFPIFREFADDAAAGTAGLVRGDVWATSSSNTLSLPAGVLMIKQ